MSATNTLFMPARASTSENTCQSKLTELSSKVRVTTTKYVHMSARERVPNPDCHLNPGWSAYLDANGQWYWSKGKKYAFQKPARHACDCTVLGPRKELEHGWCTTWKASDGTVHVHYDSITERIDDVHARYVSTAAPRVSPPDA